MEHSLIQILQIVVDSHDKQISQYKFPDGQGIDLLVRENGVRLGLDVAETLLETNWIVSIANEGRVLLEPSLTADIYTPPFVFHVSLKANRDQIMSKGLVPSSGKNTLMLRSFPPRTFFALDLFAAFEFVGFQCADRLPEHVRAKRRMAGDKIFVRSELDLWRIRSIHGQVFHRDILFSGKAVYTEAHMPSANCSRVRPLVFVREDLEKKRDEMVSAEAE